jgi:hypothetical protein
MPRRDAARPVGKVDPLETDDAYFTACPVVGCCRGGRSMLNASVFHQRIRSFIMRHFSLPIGILAIACGLLAGATTAQAVPETWVSRTGSDGGTCPITAPCKTFQAAFFQTTTGGTINVLTSGNFGPVAITKSISIVAQGVEAVISTAAGGAAIRVLAGAADIVSLRGLTIDVSGSQGISFVSGAALHVQNCVIRKTTNGINFAPAS